MHTVEYLNWVSHRPEVHLIESISGQQMVQFTVKTGNAYTRFGESGCGLSVDGISAVQGLSTCGYQWVIDCPSVVIGGSPPGHLIPAPPTTHRHHTGI